DRTRKDYEYELINTGVFDEDRYFDVFVEYAKNSPEDILIQISIVNRGPDAAKIHVLPTLWFRNTWEWWAGTPKPLLKEIPTEEDVRAVAAQQNQLGERFLYCEGTATILFTENETNNERIFGTPNQSRCVKDSINNYVVSAARDGVSADGRGTKAAIHYQLS